MAGLYEERKNKRTNKKPTQSHKWPRQPISKWDKQTSLKRQSTDSQWIHEKVLNLAAEEGQNQTTLRIPLPLVGMVII